MSDITGRASNVFLKINITKLVVNYIYTYIAASKSKRSPVS